MKGGDARINAILACIGAGDVVADVGCDHGKVAVGAAMITGKRVFATDISAPSLKKAQELVGELGLCDKVTCITGDGLFPVEGLGVDTVVIAGMGGLEIIKILSAANERYRKYILVPHRDAKSLREYLINNCYCIKSDKIVKEGGKYYPVIRVEGKGSSAYSGFELYYGKEDCNERNDFVAERQKYLRELLPQSAGKGREEITAEIKAAEELNEN